MRARRHLRTLAHRLGILAEYLDQAGKRQRTSDAARVALLATMGVDGSSEAAARRALEALDRQSAERWLDPVRVVAGGAGRVTSARIRLPFHDSDTVTWRAELREEDGPTHVAEGRARRRTSRDFLIPHPCPRGLGYHRLCVRVKADGGWRDREQLLIVAPRACCDPQERLGDRKVFGLCASLYTVRSRRNWGVGDLTDLGELAAWAGQVGAAFVGLSPLHALRNHRAQISPYCPVSRLFRNVLYIDVEAVPELSECSPARRRLASGELRSLIEQLRQAQHVDYERVFALKVSLLERLHRTFLERHGAGRTARGRAYRRFLEAQGEPLTEFATFMALESHVSHERPTDRGWRDWPEAYRAPDAPDVQAFRRTHADDVTFNCYLQFELDRQLAQAARRAEEAGLPLGLYQDLAVGSARDGSDTWAWPHLFIDGASIGAPPDMFYHAGQDWGLPPIDPRALRADGYRYWILLLRAALRHAGALRIDHVMGLFRQYWVPVGESATRGAYVRQPANDLLGILALESARHGAIVVGEDLGTVPRGLRQTLARWNILSSKVLYFERAKRGTFHPSSAYPAAALATVNTHDLPTLPGFWQGRDLELKRRTGQLANDEQLAAARKQRERDRRALLRRLSSEGLLARGAEPRSTAHLCQAVHAFLSRTPAVMVGLSLDDLTGESDPVNMPGVGLDRYPSWSRRLQSPLEALATDPAVVEGVSGVRDRRIGRRSPA